jgi:hypothetical protein
MNTENIVVMTELPKAGAGGNRIGRKGNPNRYAYKVGSVQRIIQQIVKNPNSWFLARENASNRSSLAPTLGKYAQIEVATRKQENGTYNIYVMYVPNSDGSMDANLFQDLREWDSRDNLDKQRKEAIIASTGILRTAYSEVADTHTDTTSSDYSV